MVGSGRTLRHAGQLGSLVGCVVLHAAAPNGRRAVVRKEKEAGMSARRALPGLQTGSDCAPRSPSTHKGSSRRELLTPVRAPRLGCCGPDPPRASASRLEPGVAVAEVRSAIRAASVGGALESGSSTASCPPKVEASARRKRPRLLPVASVKDPAEGAFAWRLTNSLLGPVTFASVPTRLCAGSPDRGCRS